MSKKLLKTLLCLIAVASCIAGVIYFINHKKKLSDTLEEDDDFEEKEETLDAVDALDLSSLKFSRHYVDLR